MNNKVNDFYIFDELRTNTRTSLDKMWFKYKIFRKFYREYLSRTPESDSLYRRRNRLIILITSSLFYLKTANKIFHRIELDIFSTYKGFSIKKLVIPFGKSFYFLSLIFASQVFVKYIYYLNKVFKSYQFALEGVLKYEIMENKYIYKGDNDLFGKFDLLDSENIKKNQ